VNDDNRLTKDEFAVAVHLINRKLAGDEIPTSLPPSLIPPSMRSKGTHSSSPPSPLSPKQRAKFKSPPPPPPKRVLSRVKRSHSSLSIDSTTPNHFPHLNVPTSTLPQNLIQPPKVQSNFPTPPLSPSNYPEADYTSPFEDPVNGTSPSRHHSLLASKLVPPNHSNNEALEEFKKEISRLTLQVNSLLSQLTSQNKLHDDNESLRKERDSLKAEMREMERTVSEVLSANDQNGSEEQYIQEINRLSTELASKEVEHESTHRLLAVLTEEDTDLRQQLRESQAATAKAKSENEDLLQKVASRDGDIFELRARLSDMGKEMAEGPESTSSNNRELRVLLRDVTRENDSLKGQVRDMQKSMEQLLLSTKSHAKFDEAERENRRLQAHVQELEMLASQIQSNPNNSTQLHHNPALDEAARENEQLKVQLQTGHRVFAEFQTSSESTIDELQRKLATMEHENNQLKMEVANSSERVQADNSIPPPAYNDSFSNS
jgi:epidermal growth factor receptor substrate 15